MGQLKQHASPKPGSWSLGAFKVVIIMHFHIIVTPHDHEVFITILHSYCIIIACYFSNKSLLLRTITTGMIEVVC